MSFHDRLRAAITARQERAQAASGLPYTTESPGWDVINFQSAEGPAFVLRQCARDLKVLERHRDASTAFPDQHTFCDDSCTGIRCQWCGYDAPCPDVRDLADAYDIVVDVEDEASSIDAGTMSASAIASIKGIVDGAYRQEVGVALDEIEGLVETLKQRIGDECDEHMKTMRAYHLMEAERDELTKKLAEAGTTIIKLRLGAVYGPNRRCRRCGGKPDGHQMWCQHYVGPLDHIMSFDDINGTFGGEDWRCTCGGYRRRGGLHGIDMDEPMTCPHEDEFWRGPPPRGPGEAGAS